MAEVWELVHQERRALIEDLSGLPDEQWDTPSLCGEWTVHDVAAHLIANAKTTRLGLVVEMARARFDFDRQNTQGVARERGATPQATLSHLKAVVARRSTPPAPLDSRLVEEVIHGEDIRRPLGIVRCYPGEAVAPALRYQARTSVAVGGGKQRVQGLRLRATDTDLTIGEGPQVAGPAVSLLLAVSGRAVALADLTGRGASRLEAALRG